MPNQVANYDGSITTSPRQLVYPETVEEIQAILPTRYVFRALSEPWETITR